MNKRKEKKVTICPNCQLVINTTHNSAIVRHLTLCERLPSPEELARQFRDNEELTSSRLADEYGVNRSTMRQRLQLGAKALGFDYNEIARRRRGQAVARYRGQRKRKQNNPTYVQEIKEKIARRKRLEEVGLIDRFSINRGVRLPDREITSLDMCHGCGLMKNRAMNADGRRIKGDEFFCGYCLGRHDFDYETFARTSPALIPARS